MPEDYQVISEGGLDFFYFTPKKTDWKYVGKRTPVVDGFVKVTGRIEFPMDVYLPGMLYGKILRSKYPHANIVKIDTSKAEALPGVKAVITRQDLSKAALEILYGSPIFSDKMRVASVDAIAAVAAVDEETAEEALDLIAVEYDVLPPILEVAEARKSGAPLITSGKAGNLERHFELADGDLEKGFTEADFVMECTFNNYGAGGGELWEVQSRAAIGLTVFVADYADGKLRIWDSQNNPSGDRATFAKAVDLPPKDVQVLQAAGPATFGSRDANVGCMAALLSRKTGRPVRIANTIDDDIMMGVRARVEGWLKIGVKKDGTITALHTKFTDTCGGYMGSVTEPNGIVWMTDLYQPKNWKIEIDRIFTNRLVTMDVRGYGHPEIAVIIDTCMDEVAEKIGMDPVEFRDKQHMRPYKATTTCVFGLNCEAFSEALKKGAEVIGWKEKWHKPGTKKLPNGKLHGIGVALNIKGMSSTFIGDTARVKITRNGEIVVSIGTSQFGTSNATTMQQIAAETLDVPIEKVRMVWGDTDACPFANSTAGSSASHLCAGNTVAWAAYDVKKELLRRAAIMLKSKPEDLEIVGVEIRVKAEPTKKTTIDSVASTYGEIEAARGYVIPDAIMTKYGNPKPVVARYQQYTTGAFFVEVEVDPETGQVEVVNWAYPADVGKPGNPDIVEGQISGGAYLGLGCALTEALYLDKATGRYLNITLTEYKVPTAMDAPSDLPINFMDVWDPISVVGGKGVGEGTAVPIAPGIINAIYNATGGARIRELPITPDKILKALGKL